MQHALHRQPQRVHQRGRAARPLCRPAGLPPAEARARRSVRDVLCGVLGRRHGHGRAPEPAGALGRCTRQGHCSQFHWARSLSQNHPDMDS